MRKVQKPTLSPGYVKEKKRLYGKNGKGRARAISELQNVDIVAQLGMTPTYIHSHKIYFNTGLKTAKTFLEKRLDSIVDEAHAIINSVLPIMDQNVQDIMHICGFGDRATDWKKFRSWWETDVENFKDNDNPEALIKLGILRDIKDNATHIKLYESLRRKMRIKNDTETSSAALEQLMQSGFVSQDFLGRVTMRATKGDRITTMKEKQREILTTLAAYFKEHGLEDDQKKRAAQIKAYEDAGQTGKANQLRNSKSVFQTMYDNFLNGIKNPTSLNATAIGQAVDYLSEYTKEVSLKNVTDTISIAVKNTAAEKTGGDNKIEKQDSTITFTNKDGNIVSIDVSNKSGATPDWKLLKKSTGKKSVTMSDIKLLDVFTSSVSTDSWELASAKSPSIFSFQEGEIDKLTGLFSYIIKNSDFQGRREQDGKDLILSFFAWSKLLTDMIGLRKDGRYPSCIRIFNKLYQTADTLRVFTNVRGKQILKWLISRYLTDYYKTFELVSIPSMDAINTAKHNALTTMKSPVTYTRDEPPGLKQLIEDVLKNINGAGKNRAGIHTSFNIIEDNLQRLTKHNKKE